MTLMLSAYVQEKVQVGDVIDEINGHAVVASVRGKLGSIMRQAAGKPISLCLVKVRLSYFTC
jgi:hypothetical protein